MRSFKYAFTMLELVFVIVVIGILSAVMLPKIFGNKDNLYLAAHQLVSDIRYTQHLAMIDDQFDASDSTWFKKRWQLRFSKTAGSDNHWSYTIYSDKDADGVPDASEIATSQLDKSKKLTGGYSAGTIPYSSSKASKELNLGHKYSISDITMSGGCAINNDGKKIISFDHTGRPIAGPIHVGTVTAPYFGIKLIKSTCKIDLKTTNGDSLTVAIEPETGYVHIL